MDRALARKLKVFMGGLLIAGYGALAATETYGFGLLSVPLLVLALMPLGERLDRRYRWYRQLTTYLTLALMGLLLAYFMAMLLGVIRFDLLGPVTVLVMYIQTYEVMHVKEERNYLHIFLMAFFMLVAASVQAPNAAISLVLFLFLVSAAGALMMLQLYRDSRWTRHGPEATVIPLKHAQQAGDRSHASNQRMGLTLSLTAITAASVLLTTAVFYTTPRTEAGLFGRSQSAGSASIGLGRFVDLTRGGDLSDDTTVVFQAEFPDMPDGRYEGELLWRAGVLDSYTGQSWEHRGVQPREGAGMAQLEFERVDDSTVTRTSLSEDETDLVHQVIRVEEQGYTYPYLPGLSLIKRLETENVSVAWDVFHHFSVMQRELNSAPGEYEVWSEVRDPDPAALRETPTDYQTIFRPEAYHVLTEHDLEERTLRLIERLTNNSESVYDQVAALERYLSSPRFIYSLEVPTLPSDNPMDAFIHDYRAGHCEYFASAMALMVRRLGVPARLVTGYRGGNWDEEEEAYLVQSNMAHVWVEAYFPGWGWVNFDPSPREDDEDEGGMWATLGYWANTLHIRSRMMWYRDIVGYEPAVRLEDLFNRRRLSGFVPFWGEGGQAWGGMSLSKGIPLVTVGLGLLGLGGAAVWFAVQWKELQFVGSRPRAPLSRDQLRAIRLYLRLRRRLRRIGIPCEGKTAQEVLGEARCHPAVDPDVLEEVVHVYDTVRFGNRALDARRYRDMRRAIKRLVRGRNELSPTPALRA
ncbi:MAG: transglutaminaseTgpA domain-containing protein [Candidatus Hydrogenedentota bacterium]